ncbi:solute carrier family 35 member C2 [Leptopilina heterotoma]|uniref:solute carrier family 35 member C2 n=1 Tax=Leptopilina heterotoma TaxID=63436 RepID=UPI001CA7C7DE|nr:solute carrier family 35 member C2 [Leptopilina heterotoma]XP_043474667.1 solute carrier family 35 member C2 [Leptopilina heterotoma]
MPRFNVKYEIARDEVENTEYFLQNDQNLQTPSKKQLVFQQNQFLLIIIICPYFVLSMGLTFYQKWLFKTYDFNYPLATVVIHSLLKYILCALINCGRTICRERQPIRLPWKTVVWALAIPGFATGIDVGLSNKSLKFISVPLYTMTKSTSIIFILFFAVLFKLERKSASMFFIVLMISGGLIMFTYESTSFHLLGFTFCLIASFSSGIRWTLAQLVMQKTKLGFKNPIDMMYYMQPWILLSTVFVTFLLEGEKIYNGLNATDWNNLNAIYLTVTYIVSGGIIAFCMEIFEFLVVTYTSSLTLSIIGILKEFSIFIIAFKFGEDRMNSSLNFFGLLMCLCGLILHVIHKMRSKKEPNDNAELQINSSINSMSIDGNSEEGMEINCPLLLQKSTSLSNLLNSNFSSDDDEEESKDTNNSQSVLNVLQHRDK